MEYKSSYFKLSKNYEVTVNGSIAHDRIEIQKCEEEINELKSSERYKGHNVIGRKNEVQTKVEQLERLIQECESRRFTLEDEKSLNKHLVTNSVDGWKLYKMEPILKGVYYENNDTGYSFNAQEGFLFIWEKE